MDYQIFHVISFRLYFVPFCLPPDESGLSQKKWYPKKATTIPARPVRRGYTTRLREGALISFCSLVASASVILLLGQKF